MNPPPASPLVVFVTGGTGTLGKRVVQRLVSAGHAVGALARSPRAAARLEELGAEPVPGSLFDRDSLEQGLQGSDYVLHLATRIPPAKRALRRSAWRENDEIRRAGTRTLVDAAQAAGVGGFVYTGVCFCYPDRGAAWIDSATPPDRPSLLASSLDAEEAVGRFAERGGRGVTLRMGYFYGTDAPNTLEALALARRGMSPVVGPGSAFLPQIWVDDAASAVVAAMDARLGGTFDVVDDDPLTRTELRTRIARAVGRRRLLALPPWMEALVLGRHGRFLGRSQRVSNARFREASGWAPRVPSAREGWERIGGQLRQSQLAGSSPTTPEGDADRWPAP